LDRQQRRSRGVYWSIFAPALIDRHCADSTEWCVEQCATICGAGDGWQHARAQPAQHVGGRYAYHPGVKRSRAASGRTDLALERSNDREPIDRRPATAHRPCRRRSHHHRRYRVRRCHCFRRRTAPRHRDLVKPRRRIRCPIYCASRAQHQRRSRRIRVPGRRHRPSHYQRRHHGVDRGR